jgi:hypothetical protein
MNKYMGVGGALGVALGLSMNQRSRNSRCPSTELAFLVMRMFQHQPPESLCKIEHRSSSNCRIINK